MADRGFTPTQLAARAAYLLRGNDLGTMTSAAPKLYPHMWSWDAAFVAVGLAPLSVERAVVELDTLLSAQWKNGMIPHIVFANGVDGYFPGPTRWDVNALAAHAPLGTATSGITQPPFTRLRCSGFSIIRVGTDVRRVRSRKSSSTGAGAIWFGGTAGWRRPAISTATAASRSITGGNREWTILRDGIWRTRMLLRDKCLRISALISLW